MVNGKQKGGSFERLVAQQLSLWLSGGKQKDLFWRNAMSGGRATVARGAVRQAGDICAVAPEGHVLTDRMYLETKHLKEVSLDALIKGKGVLISVWETVQKEAAKYNKIPVFIFRQNHYPTVFCTSAEGVAFLQIASVVCIESRGMFFVRFDELLKLPFTTFTVPGE